MKTLYILFVLIATTAAFLVAGPLAAAVVLLVLLGLWFVLLLLWIPYKAAHEATEKRIVGDTSSHDSKKCPYCAELIKREAIVCRFCGKELPSSAQKRNGDHGYRVPKSDREITIQAEDYKTIGELESYARKYGYSRAKYLLAMIYLDGTIVEKNEKLAKHWLQRAADEKYDEAVEALKGIT